MAEWTDKDVERIVVNPIYTGMGTVPQIVTDDMFVKAAQLAIRRMGSEAFLRKMLKELRESLDGSHVHVAEDSILPCDRTDEHMHCTCCGRAYADADLHDGMKCECGASFRLSKEGEADGRNV
jgi:hypothetical protein